MSILYHTIVWYFHRASWIDHVSGRKPGLQVDISFNILKITEAQRVGSVDVDVVLGILVKIDICFTHILENR